MSTLVGDNGSQLVFIECGKSCGGHHNRRWAARHAIRRRLGCFDDHDIAAVRPAHQAYGVGMRESVGAHAPPQSAADSKDDGDQTTDGDGYRDGCDGSGRPPGVADENGAQTF